MEFTADAFTNTQDGKDSTAVTIITVIGGIILTIGARCIAVAVFEEELSSLSLSRFNEFQNIK